MESGRRSRRAKVHRARTGNWVYFIQCDGPGGPIKIGITCVSPDSRLATLQTATPFDLRLLGACRFASPDRAKSAEYTLHLILKEHRIRGEWFRPHQDVLSEVDFYTNVHPAADAIRRQRACPLNREHAAATCPDIVVGAMLGKGVRQ